MPATIFSGTKVKTLKGTLTLNDQADIITGTANPQSSATAGNPGSLYLKTDTGDVYRKLDSGSSTNWSLVGSEGSAGVNVVGLNTAHQLQTPTDRNAEVSVGNWVTYDDGAVAAPVDMTGGSPGQVTLSRTTTGGEVLNGVASFKVVKAAADGQGEGWSVVCNIPEGYRGRQVAIKFPFKLISGTLVQGDLKLYAYDVTNSVVLTPFNNDVVGSQGSVIALFSTQTSTAQIRVGFHLATTAATAFTIVWDDIEVTPTSEALGAAITEFQAFTATVTAVTTNPTKGTTSRDNARWRRVGDCMEILWDYEQTGAGTAGSGVYLLALPTGYSLDTTKLAAQSGTNNINGLVGLSHMHNPGSTSTLHNAKMWDSTHIAMVSGPDSAGQQTWGSGYYDFSVSDLQLSMRVMVPIAGWSSNVTIGSSSTYTMSSILANGTRVTAVPTKLGEYRTYIKDASSANFTDNAPSAGSITTANGMRIFADAYPSAGTSGEPNKWEIFIGKNKNHYLHFWSGTGHTGKLYGAQHYTELANGAQAAGCWITYNPDTGVLVVDAGFTASTISAGNHVLGYSYDDNGDFSANIIDGYFDVTVSENALAVGVQSPRSESLAHTGNGHGSTNTKVRRFSSSSTVGSAITYADSATNGASFTINETGVYDVGYSDIHSSAANIGISVNSSTLTTNIESVTISNGKKIIGSLAANAYTEVSATLNLNSGDVVRPHTDGTPSNTTDNVIFRVTKVSN